MSKKEEIIETAISLFLQNSFTTVGIDRVIVEADVAKMTFYKYFLSKEILIEECLIMETERYKIEITQKINSAQSHDYIGKIKAIYDWHIHWFELKSFKGCIFQKATAEILSLYPSVIDLIKSYKMWLFHTISNLLLKLNIPQPHFLPSIFINILDGIISYAKIDQENIQMESLWNYIENLINYDCQKN